MKGCTEEVPSLVKMRPQLGRKGSGGSRVCLRVSVQQDVRAADWMARVEIRQGSRHPWSPQSFPLSVLRVPLPQVMERWIYKATRVGDARTRGRAFLGGEEWPPEKRGIG